ncbi:MAG: IS200/IS605 family element transposase accessory protein TnpB [Acaryochloridaceae cyanobacterium RU_4_10]|nr:IS200/IS605 family element transposase accessory protein TnpB [Acaryochloridaceae cyanobacterium RU_4_10]
MEQTLTVVCKLQPSVEQVAMIEATLKAFADGCNFANEAVKPTVTNKARIQAEIYEQLRGRFELSANLAVRACARVGAARKAAKQHKKPVREFKPTSVDYDARIFAFREKDCTVSLTLIGGREHIPLMLANYQIGKLKGRKPTAAVLAKRRDGSYYINIQVSDEAPDPIKVDNVIGVDFGRTDIAVTSEGEKFSGKQITQVRDRFSRVRASLQSKGTKGAKRVLKRLSGREQKFQRWVNHNISRRIIERAKEQNAAVAIEDLTGIRNRTNKQPRTKTERRRSNSWAFYQLRWMLEYKGIQAGIPVVKVNPAYTSQTCHQCLHIGLRSGKRFKCGHCGWHGDADLNGSLMVRILGGVVSHPESSVLCCPIQAA